MSFRGGYNRSSCYCERSLSKPANKLTAGTPTLTFLSQWPVQSTVGREVPTLGQCEPSPRSHHSDPERREGEKVIHTGINSSLASILLWVTFQLALALVHTTKYIQSLHSCTCQNTSIRYLSCYYGNFVVTGSTLLASICTHTVPVVMVQQSYIEGEKLCQTKYQDQNFLSPFSSLLSAWLSNPNGSYQNYPVLMSVRWKSPPGLPPPPLLDNMGSLSRHLGLRRPPAIEDREQDRS